MIGLRRVSLVLLLLAASSLVVQAQSPARPDHPTVEYTRKNTFSVFAEYSNNSSHILLGQARNRKLATLGGAYARRIFLRPSLDLQYMAEMRPVLFESDPVTTVNQVYTGQPANGTSSYTAVFDSKCPAPPRTINGVQTSGPYQGTPYTIVLTDTCSRQWTYGQGVSPAGLKLNLRPRHRLQPFFTLTTGYLFTTKPIPTAYAGSYNFTFAFGAGLEFYTQRALSTSIFGNRSLRAEYRYQHISNAWSASQNPGIDSGVLQVAFAFGR